MEGAPLQNTRGRAYALNLMATKKKTLFRGDFWDYRGGQRTKKNKNKRGAEKKDFPVKGDSEGGRTQRRKTDDALGQGSTALYTQLGR